MLLELSLMFSKLCVFAFGGGYVMIPIMLRELEIKGWATALELTDVVAIAGMSPGPVAVNAAVGMGYKVAGFPGVIAAFLGITVPNILIIIIVAVFFFKVYDHPTVKDAFYGLRPVITGIIFYAAVSFAVKNGVAAASSDQIITNGYNVFFKGVQLFELKSLIIMLGAFLTLVKLKVHPIFVIIASGILGIIMF